MSGRYYILVNDKAIQFTNQEVADISSGDAKKIWNSFYSACRHNFKYIVDTKPDFLTENGFEHVESVLSANDVETFKNIWDGNFIPRYIARNSKAFEMLKKGDKNSYSVRNFSINEDSIPYVMSIISKVLTLSLTKKIEAFYESHFSINYVLFSETVPDQEPITSFRWHRDGGPDSQLHIMVYLDGYEQTGGKTEFLNYADSNSVKERGYNSDISENRTLNIHEIFPEARIISPEPKAGDLLIFNATRTLHRGVHPKNNSRKVMTLIIQPDFMPWPHSVLPQNLFSAPLGRFLLEVNPFFPYQKLIEG